MTPRLPWHRTEDGFRAYPDGEDHPDRVASITKDDRGLYQWAWTVRYERARREGRSDTAQEAADEVTRIWPEMAGRDAAIVAAEIEAADLENAMERAAEGGPLELDVAAETYERLIRANWHLREHFERKWQARLDTTHLEAVMLQISTELAKRRERGEVPAPPRYGGW